MLNIDEIMKRREVIGTNKGYYFPRNVDIEIQKMIVEYIENMKLAYILSGTSHDFNINHAAQEGFVVINGSIAFRVLTNYKGKQGHIAVNFPNWRDWETVLPLNSKNHFIVKGSNQKKHHGYKHSFLFKNNKEFIEFFNTYMTKLAI